MITAQNQQLAYTKRLNRVQGSNLIPLFSEQEYVSRRNGVAYLPQKPEQYSIAEGFPSILYGIPFWRSGQYEIKVGCFIKGLAGNCVVIIDTPS